MVNLEYSGSEFNDNNELIRNYFATDVFEHFPTEKQIIKSIFKHNDNVEIKKFVKGVEGIKILKVTMSYNLDLESPNIKLL